MSWTTAWGSVSPPLTSPRTWERRKRDEATFGNIVPALCHRCDPIVRICPATCQRDREHIHDYSPSATYTVTVATSVPLDILLEPGEQVRNVIGGDREPATEETQTRRWVVKEGGDGAGEGLRHHIFVSVTEPGLTMGMI